MPNPITAMSRGTLASLVGRLPRGVNALLVILCLAWVISPFDFDWVPIVGWIDDAAAAWFAWLNVNEVFRKSAAARMTIPGTARRSPGDA